MKTAVEWLIDKHFGGIENCTPDFKKHIEQAIEMEKKQQEDFAISFVEWMAKEYWLNSSGKYTQGQTHKELLEIYKKQL